jgi:hypothetical protein
VLPFLARALSVEPAAHIGASASERRARTSFLAARILFKAAERMASMRSSRERACAAAVC